MWLARLVLAVATALAAPVHAQQGRSADVFVFGNSLVHHLTDEGRSNVPYWLSRLAVAGGQVLRLDGRWGFLRDFARDLPAEPNWRIDGVDPVMPAGIGFRRAGIDTVIVTPANFIQARAPDRPYEGDNPTGDSPLSATLRVLDWTAEMAPGSRVLIYEGWALMSTITRFPPDGQGLRRYQLANRGDYHDWFVDYAAAIRQARPDLDVKLIPAASTIARILTETPLSEVDATYFYEDEAPHGTEPLYFLAALVSYASIFGEMPPAFGDLAQGDFPALAANEQAIRRIVWEEVSGAIVPDRVRFDIPETGVRDPSMAMGLAGISDWSTQHPFLDLMKTARPWVGHLPGQWGGVGFDELMAAGHLTDDGWPLSIPERVDAIETYVLTDQPVAATSLIGRYLVTWAGQGDLSLGGGARNVRREGAGQFSFDYRPGPGPVSIRIDAVDAADPIRDIRVFRVDNAPLIEAGAVFDPAFIRTIRDLRSIRFMDWMDTNGSDLVTWSDRPKPSDFSFAWRGVPVEWMVRLANEVGAEPWFTLPHMADDDHVRRFADAVRAGLDPRLPVRVEWSNEIWNFVFAQAHWAAQQAEDRWGAEAAPDAWMQFAGARAAEVARLWLDRFGEEAGRVIPVVAVHTGWPGLESALLDAPLARSDGDPPPGEAFRAYAVTGYFGAEIGREDNLPRLRRWAGADDGIGRLAEAVRDGSFATLTDDLWPHHAAVARDRGLDLIMYEGGTHVTGHGAVTRDAAVTDLFVRFSYSPQMARLYSELLAVWDAAGGQLFNAFVDTAPPSRWGSWGAWRYPGDVNPRAATLLAHASRPGPVASDAYLHGVYRIGTAIDDIHIGTEEADLLLGAAGDDRFQPMGGNDIIHGGPGHDTVILGRAADEWQRSGDGETVVMTGPSGIKRLTAIELVEFDDGRVELAGQGTPP